MKLTLIPYIILVSLGIFSCDRLERKGIGLIRKVKGTIAEQVDKVFSTYDYDKQDTYYNKRRFQEHLGIEISPDVQGIYAYGDFLGADYLVLLTFTCDSSTVSKIVRVKGLTRSFSQNDTGLGFSHDLKWWVKEEISRIAPFKMEKLNNRTGLVDYKEYLWYNPTTKKAYYQEFSL